MAIAKKIATKSIETQLIDITPAQAQSWLEQSKFENRSLSQRNVDRIKRDILRGDWVFDGNPIRFDDHDNVLDGQHRLWAIFESGKTVRSLLVRGLPKSSVNTIDSGKTRNNADIFHFNGYKNTTVLSGLCRLVIGYRESGGDMWSWALNRALKRLSPQELMAEADRNKSLVASANATSNLRYCNKFLGKSTCAFIHYVLAKEGDPFAVNNFFLGLEGGKNLETDSPLLVLRNAVALRELNIADAGGGNKATAFKLALVIKAWNAYREKRQIQRLRFAAGKEAYPTPVK